MIPLWSQHKKEVNSPNRDPEHIGSDPEGLLTSHAVPTCLCEHTHFG
jgi:hypothetical protein